MLVMVVSKDKLSLSQEEFPTTLMDQQRSSSGSLKRMWIGLSSYRFSRGLLPEEPYASLEARLNGSVV
jgi:hypothetical protein